MYCILLLLYNTYCSSNHHSRWHDIVKDEILKEIDNLKADITAYNSGNLLLLTSIDHDGGVGSTSSNEGGGDCVHDETNVNSASKTKRKLHAPKSILFRALSLTSLTKTSNNNDDRRKTIFWRRKKKGNSTVTVKESTNECYDSPSIV